MPSASTPDLSLFFSILQTLEHINAPYMIIGAFAATMYGSTRVTYDIDIVVDLDEQHIQALATAYPPPRYYADPDQRRDSIQKGIMFNIIDSSQGAKADLIPLSMAVYYRRAFQRRIRPLIELSGLESFEVWSARPDDVILGKLIAWREGRSRKHEIDIFEMMVFHYSLGTAGAMEKIDETYVDVEAEKLGIDVQKLWEEIKIAARQEATRE